MLYHRPLTLTDRVHTFFEAHGRKLVIAVVIGTLVFVFWEMENTTFHHGATIFAGMNKTWSDIV